MEKQTVLIYFSVPGLSVEAIGVGMRVMGRVGIFEPGLKLG